jgi:alpha-galactosidase
MLAATAAMLAAATVVTARAEAPKGKVKVFILAGQSNMQGKGSMKHLEELAAAEQDKYAWALKQRDDVWCFFGDLGDRKKDHVGKLEVGKFTYPGGRVGPEMGIGKVLGDAIDEPVVLLKACWGGQSLAVDFRPPSAGKWDKPFTTTLEEHWKPGTVGWAYKQIFNEKHYCLDDIGKTFPDLAGREYEICGLVWIQGWNDLINPDRVKEYQSNMVAFIKDIRKDIGVPNLPVVIGVVGVDGHQAKDNGIRAAQTGAAETPEFKGTVAAVQLADFWDPTPHGEGGYHYMGSAKFYIEAGLACGKAMLDLLKNAPPVVDHRPSAEACTVAPAVVEGRGEQRLTTE